MYQSFRYVPSDIFLSYLALIAMYQLWQTLSGAGIVLRMARLISNGLSKDETNDNAKELPRRPVKTFIVHAHDLVQIIAKVKSLWCFPFFFRFDISYV